MKNKQSSISLVIPTYNDENTIVEQITSCEKILKKYCKDYEIIVADDDSKDKTRQLLKRFSDNKHMRIILNKKNLGITKNVRQLYFLAKKDFVFFYSADGDWQTEDVEHLIKKQQQENADIVIGKRKSKIGYTPYRHMISFFHKLLPLLFFGVNTIDPGGIKLIRRELAQIPLVSTGQFFEAEMIIRAKKNKYKVSWYPVVYKKIYYGSGYGGGFSSAIQSVWDIFKMRFSHL